VKWPAAFSGIALIFAASAASASPPDQETEHLVVSGETLNGIANRAKVKRDVIIKANALKPPYNIRIGQKLSIPRGGQPATRPGANKKSPTPSGSATYTVKSGDTLGGIANREQVPRILIAEANRIEPPYTLRVGQKLLIPRTRHHVVKDGETGFAISYQFAVPWQNIAIANGLEPKAALRPGQKLLIPTVLNTPGPAQTSAKPAPKPSSRFAWPLNGPVHRGFKSRGSGDYHDGLDITAPRGSAVRAAEAGEVIFARRDKAQFGNLVVVDHGGGWHSAYGSLSRITVKKGHRVTKGERVGLVGDTSITKRTELHFELRRDGKPVDPLSQLPGKP